MIMRKTEFTKRLGITDATYCKLKSDNSFRVYYKAENGNRYAYLEIKAENLKAYEDVYINRPFVGIFDHLHRKYGINLNRSNISVLIRYIVVETLFEYYRLTDIKKLISMDHSTIHYLYNGYNPIGLYDIIKNDVKQEILKYGLKNKSSLLRSEFNYESIAV